MKLILIAISFFTRIPIKVKINENNDLFSKSMMLVPIVGLLIGSILYITSFILKFNKILILNTLLIVSIYMIITGGIHYDGVADTIDGFFSARSREDILRIMKDPHIGTFGTIALIMFILSFFILNMLILEQRLFSLLIVYPVIGRFAAIELGAFFKAANNNGLGYYFCSTDSLGIFLTYLFIILFFLFYFKNYNYIVSFGIIIVTTILTGLYFKRKINGITGDQLGFIIEFTQIIFLISVFFFKNMNS